jgi:hypothetical protein
LDNGLVKDLEVAVSDSAQLDSTFLYDHQG